MASKSGHRVLIGLGILGALGLGGLALLLAGSSPPPAPAPMPPPLPRPAPAAQPPALPTDDPQDEGCRRARCRAHRS